MEASHIHKLSRQVPKDPVQSPNLGGRRRGPSQHPPRDREARVNGDLRGKQIPGAPRHRRDVDFHTGKLLPINTVVTNTIVSRGVAREALLRF